MISETSNSLCVRSKSLKKIYRVARTSLKRARGSDYEVNEKLREEEMPSIQLQKFHQLVRIKRDSQLEPNMSEITRNVSLVVSNLCLVFVGCVLCCNKGKKQKKRLMLAWNYTLRHRQLTNQLNSFAETQNAKNNYNKWKK